MTIEKEPESTKECWEKYQKCMKKCKAEAEPLTTRPTLDDPLISFDIIKYLLCTSGCTEQLKACNSRVQNKTIIDLLKEILGKLT